MFGETAAKLLAVVAAQLDQGRPITPRDAAQLLDVCVRSAQELTRSRTVPADLSGRQAELEAMLSDLSK